MYETLYVSPAPWNRRNEDSLSTLTTRGFKFELQTSYSMDWVLSFEQLAADNP
jgi:hypothetical protein